MLRVAVVGVGHLGSYHARIWSAHPDAELVALVDPAPARRSALAAELGVPAFESLAELPAELDLVSIAVPTALHAEVAVPLLERGVACLIEKPLSSDLASADRILAAAERGGATLSVGHVERFQPGLRKVREMGIRPRFIECHRLAPFSFRSTDIGVVHDLMIHDLDLILDLMGDSPIASVDAAGGRIVTGMEDVASVRIVFADGGRANVTASRVALQPMRRFRLFSSEGYISLDFHKNYGLLVKKGPEWEAGLAALAQLDSSALAEHASLLDGSMLQVVEMQLDGGQRPLQAELDAFLRAVEEGRAPEVSGQDGRRALELADRIARDIRAQTW